MEALSNESAKFDLNVVVIPDAGQPYRRNRETEGSGMIMIWEYSTDLFCEDTIARLTTHYQNLLAAIVSDPRQRISELPLLSGPEHQQLVSEWNETGRAFPRERCLHELFSAQVEQTPYALAIADDEQQWSYEELDRRSSQLAHHLRGLGIGPEARVGILLPRSCEFVLAVLAVVKAGGAYVPLDPQHPAERILFMLRDVGAAVVLTEENLAKDVMTSDASVVLLDRHRAQFAAAAATPLKLDVATDNLAYIIYTSGSTGQPKGVAVTHSGLMNLVRWHQETYGVGSADRASQVASPSFDASVMEIWPCLTAGASLHVAPSAILAAPALLVSWLVKNEISISFLPTPLAEAVLEESWPEKCALRYLLTGGDRLHAVAPKRWPFALVNHYGPTENSVVTTICIVDAERPNDLAPPIGRPIANTEVYVLDRALRPVPVGVEGELYLSGKGLARGYWQQPALTAERFLPNPFSKREGGRLYHTGDLVRYLPDGKLEFLGRIDSQVKLRGYRIELGEIEAELRRHAEVREAVVELKQHERGEPRLVGYIVLNGDDGDKSAMALRNYLHERLPEYMVPGAFVLLPELPLTPNGKVDRRALAELDDGAEVKQAFVAPRNKQEKIVADIWAEVLGLSKVGVEDNFFELGGHSLLATRILARVNSALQVEITLDSLFRGRTVTSLVEAAQHAKRSDQSKPVRIASLGGRRSTKELLKNLEQLSDEQMSSLLAETLDRVNK
jgi:amino acid adenylation domain-containing protein